MSSPKQQFVVLLTYNVSDGVGDAIHCFNFYKWCLNSKLLKYCNLIPYVFLVVGSGSNLNYIENIFKTLPNEAQQYCNIIYEEKLRGRTLPLKYEDINSLFYISTYEHSTEYIDKDREIFRKLATNGQLYIYAEIHGGGMKYEEGLGSVRKEILKSQQRKMGFMNLHYFPDKQYCWSVGLPINQQYMDKTDKKYLYYHLYKDIPKIRTFVDTVVLPETKINSILDEQIVDKLVFIQIYYQTEGVRLCKYIRSYIEMILLTPVLQNKYVVFFLNAKDMFGNKFIKISTRGKTFITKYDEEKCSSLDNLYNFSNRNFIDEDGIDITDTMPKFIIYDEVLDTRLFKIMLNATSYFRVCSGDNSIIESVNLGLFPIITERHDKPIYYDFAIYYKDKFPLFYKWTKKYYNEKENGYEGILDYCNQYDSICSKKIPKDYKFVYNLEEYASHLTDKFLEEWKTIISEISVNWNTFNFFENDVLDCYKRQLKKV